MFSITCARCGGGGPFAPLAGATVAALRRDAAEVERFLAPAPGPSRSE